MGAALFRASEERSRAGVRKLRVLEMIDRPSLGGGQVHVLSLAKSLDREKFDVSVCSGGGGPLVDELRKMDVPHVAVPVFKRPSLRTRREMAGILRRGDFDILHTHGGVAGFHGRPSGRDAGIPVIVHTLHGIHYLHYGSALLRRASILLERRFSRFTDCVVCVSETDLRNAAEFKLAPPGKLKLIRNGIDASGLVRPFDPAAKKAELGLDPGRPVAGTVARLHRQKGLASLVRASRKIGEHVPGVRILIAGGGPLRDELAGEIKKERAENIVMLLGERPDAAEVLSLLDVFVLPSLWEGLPYALLEAAALGKPIAASAVDGITEVIRDGETGLLFPPGDPDKLADAAIRLFRDPQLASRLAENARTTIPPAFTLRRMVEEIGELYSTLFARKAVS